MKKIFALCLAALMLLLSACGSGNSADMQAAVETLRQMEAGDPDQVMAVIRTQKKARMDAERDSLRQQLLDGEIDVWGQFQDYAILGDSRASGFYYYGWLPQERVLAESGDTIYKLEGHIPDVIALRPARIFVSYGLNDFGSWTLDDYIDKMVEIMDTLRAELPDLEIYINSIIEVQEWAITNATWREVPQWNERLEQMCREHGYTFVDNTQLMAENQDMYEGDGMHFKSAFYPLWATNMILAMYYRDADEEPQQ